MLQGQPDSCEPAWVNAEHPLFILYTSGSTGKPKGIQHSTGGYLLWTIVTMKWVFDCKPYGHLLVHRRRRLGHRAFATSSTVRSGVGATGVDVRGSARRTRTPAACWKMIQEHRVTVFYTAPTAIRALMQGGRGS
ncbi:MAG: AMP-binding protein [Burkholderiales bacterium]|nr:AMP-binding protein [Burkholderiales bacterium]